MILRTLYFNKSISSSIVPIIASHMICAILVTSLFQNPQVPPPGRDHALCMVRRGAMTNVQKLGLDACDQLVLTLLPKWPYQHNIIDKPTSNMMASKTWVKEWLRHRSLVISLYSFLHPYCAGLFLCTRAQQNLVFRGDIHLKIASKSNLNWQWSTSIKVMIGLKRCVAIQLFKLNSIDAGNPDRLLHILPSEVGDHHPASPAFQGTDPPPWSLDSPDVWCQYAFSAARLPGAAPDRYVESEGDAEGVIRGSYAYLDPNQEWRQVRTQTRRFN